MPELYHYYANLSLLSRASTSFRHVPIDVFLRCFDSTALAMKTVLCINLEFSFIAFFINYVFIYFGRAES